MAWNFWWSQNPLKSSLLLSPSLLLLLLNFHYFQIVPSTALLIPHFLKDITTVLCFTVHKICTPRSCLCKVSNTVYDCTYSHFKNEHFQTSEFCCVHGPLFIFFILTSRSRHFAICVWKEYLLILKFLKSVTVPSPPMCVTGDRQKHL